MHEGKRSKTGSVITGSAALLFALGAAVQLNDPDPARWVAIYLAAALACVLSGRVAGAWTVAAGVALAAFFWAMWIAGQIPQWVAPTRMFEPMESRGGAVEMARELWGLGIIALAMLALVWKERRGRRGS